MMSQILKDYILGAAVGDAIALPFEGLTKQRVNAFLGSQTLQHRMVLGKGMFSDDTEHLLMTLRAFRVSDGDPAEFARALARELRLWVLAIPPGTGKATLQACGKLLMGYSPDKSGVYSAGNGPIMRSGVLGLLCGSEKILRCFVDISTRVTHTDPRAYDGALAIALAARTAATSGVSDFATTYWDLIQNILPDGDMKNILQETVTASSAGKSLEAFVDSIGCGKGVSGYILHTVPVVIFSWLSSTKKDFGTTIERALRLGGDTDSVCSSLGGLLAITCGEKEIPITWLKNLKDYPITLAYLKNVAYSDFDVGWKWRRLAYPPRNMLFLSGVLMHAARRAFPPYSGQTR